MTETSAVEDTCSRRKMTVDEMEKTIAELKELAETNRLLTETLQTLSSEKPVDNGLQVCPVCHCASKSVTHCQALKCRVYVLKENEKRRQQEIELLNRTFTEFVSKFENLIASAKPLAHGPSELMDTRNGLFLLNAAANGDNHGLIDGDNAASFVSQGKTLAEASSVSFKTDYRNFLVKESLNSAKGPSISCYGDDSDGVDEDDNEYQKPTILSKANENKTTRVTLGNPNFTPRKLQGKSVQGRENNGTHQAVTTEDQCPELSPKQTRTILVPGIPANYWADLAMAEAASGPKEKVGKISTILCLDISSSMAEGRAWHQASTFIRHFIAGIEHSLQERDITEESVALCVFGHEVRVVQQLTNHFSLLTTALDRLKVGGPSPLLGGLLMAFAGLKDPSSCQANNIEIFARIILISDGKPSSAEILAGPDSASGTQVEEENEIVAAVKNISEKEVRIHCVPVGNANQEFLEKLATISHGTVYPYTAGRKVAKKLSNTLHAGHVLKHLKMFHSLPESKDLDENKSFSEIVKSSDFMTRMIIEGYLGAVCNSEEEREEVYAIAKEAVKEGLFESEGYGKSYEKYHMEDPFVDLPPLGSRVRRGPDWNKENQDGNGPGTVVGHILNHRSVYVTWDNNGNIGNYRCGAGGEYDILVVDEPRVLKENELIQVGCLVKRGPDWIYGDQDGLPGAKGVVLRVLPNGQAIVRWLDKSKAMYRFGADGCFDLEICTPNFGGQGHTLRDVATNTSRFGGKGGLSSAPAKHSSQNVASRNKNLENKNAKVRTLFS